MTRLLAVLIIGLLGAGPGQSDPITDSLFAEGVFLTVPAGQEVHYSHVRSGPDAPKFRPVVGGSIVVTRRTEGATNLSLTLAGDGPLRELTDFSVEGGNPVLLVFLESVSRSMASLTGGSPFYIRNRIKDALRSGGTRTEVSELYAGGTVAAEAVTLHPFEDDPNRDRMGDFAGLTVRFVISPTVPGRFLSLSADTRDPATGYHETITLTDEGKVRE